MCVLLCRSAGTGRYSRLQADIRAMQHNSSTYCEEPEDTEEFQAWLAVRPSTGCISCRLLSLPCSHEQPHPLMSRLLKDCVQLGAEARALQHTCKQ